ncbi:MAG: hypothetical protein B9S32_02765 [Verrucomicrobia bacterium Tous-C9LFEB]|nr:MAG: hypothetical protein B9S32_02765 [Verrucomicrobia bacterium Tous-C9LFEB]
MKQQENKDEGFSLVMSLIFISLLSVLVVGFLTSMRVEVSSSDAHLQATKAKYFADAGTDMAIGRLKYATGTPSTTVAGLFWVTQPGRIYTATLTGTTVNGITTYKFPAGFNPGNLTAVDLFSGGDGSYSGSDDLTANLQGTVGYLMPTSTTDKIRVSWIYVRKDGTLELAPSSNVPPYSVTNPIVGRFAYWVDDESARINVNSAATRTSANLLASPSQVNMMIFGSLAQSGSLSNLITFRSTVHAINSLNDIRQVPISMGPLLDSEAFSLSINNQSPDLNMFGEPRIVLTTQERLAAGAPFLDILNTANSDPGGFDSLNTAKVNTIVNKLITMLSRDGWPYSNTSFAGKYTSSGSMADAAQIAVNIIDYVRCRESTRQLVHPIRGSVTGSSFSLNGSSGDILGVTRTLKITERMVELTADPTDTQAGLLKVTYELHLPKYSNVYGLSLKNNYTVSHYIGSYPYPYFVLTKGGLESNTNSTNISGQYCIDNINATASSLVMNAGDYVTVTMSPKQVFFKTDLNTRTIGQIIGVGVFSSGIIDSLSATISCRVDYCGQSPSVYTVSTPQTKSLATDDPWCNRSAADWKYLDKTFGGSNTNATTLGSAPLATGPQQDTDTTNRTTDLSERLPAMAGSSTTLSNNTYGVVESVAELGYINSGMRSLTASIPYRTLRMQPKRATDQSLLPDWVLMDMFSAPKLRWTSFSGPNARSATVPTQLSYSEQAVTATTSPWLARSSGQVNLNATIFPAFKNSGNNVITRSKPLEAVFLGGNTDVLLTTVISTNTSPVNTGGLATAIRNRTVTSGYRFTFTSANPLISRGEITELSGVTDASEESEIRLRGSIDQLTTRGSVFRVYAIGQAISQSAASPYPITVLGEKRTMSLVERSVAMATTSTPTTTNSAPTTTVSFKVIYSSKP